MSYDVVKPDWYRIHTPDSPWHAGAQGWSQAPWPGWGENPNLIGPRMLAVNGFGSEMSLHPTTPIPPGPVVQIAPSAPPGTPSNEKKIPWALIGLAALVAVGGYFMLKPADGRVVKSNGKMFRRNKRRRVRRNAKRRASAHGYEHGASSGMMSFRCSGCGKVDRSMFDKAGGDHWRADGICGHWVKLKRDVGPGHSGHIPNRKRRRPRRNHNLTVKGKRWVFPT